MNRITMIALAAGMSVAASGQNMMSREGTQATMPNAPVRTFAPNKAQQPRPAANVRVVNDGEENYSPYGQVVEIMREDFSKMSTGTVENPDRDAKINEYVDGGVYWWNIKPEYTTLPHWGSHFVYPAGGCLYMDADNNDGAQLNTPLIDVGGRCRIALVQFKARAVSGTATGLAVEAAETQNMSPTGWEYCAPVALPEMTEEWKTYEIMFQGTGHSTMFNFVQHPTLPICIDDIRVCQIDQYVNTPVTLPHSNYMGGSFTANWEAVDGAESYLLNVYSLDDKRMPKAFLTDQKAAGNSFVVTGIVSGETYYYTVRAVKGEHQSIESLPVEVFDLEAPVLESASEVHQAKYTARWSEVPTAERYNYWAYNVRTAEKDGEFVVTDENFDGVRDADGNLTGQTIEHHDFNSYDELYIKELSQAGWRGKHYMPYTDFICVDGWQYMNGQGDAGLISPELDLSKDNGKINLSIKLYGEIDNMYDEQGNPVPTQTQAAVALFNYNEQLGDFEQAELIYPEGVTAAWKTFNVQLTKGSKCSVIGIYAVRGPGNLYMDDLKITQNYKQGESLMEPFLYSRWHEGTSIDVDIPVKAYNAPLYHKVSAIKSRGSGNPYAGPERRESKFSNLESVVNDVSAIDGNMLREKPGVAASGNMLNITNPQGSAVAVYGVDGTQVYADNSGRGNIVVNLPSSGIYVVRIGDTVVKITK